MNLGLSKYFADVKGREKRGENNFVYIFPPISIEDIITGDFNALVKLL